MQNWQKVLGLLCKIGRKPRDFYINYMKIFSGALGTVQHSEKREKMKKNAINSLENSHLKVTLD